MPNLQTSAQMRQMIEHFEGCRLDAYQDVVGVWTIGYGHTGEDVEEGVSITQEEADQTLADDLGHFEDAVNGMVSDDTSQQQFDAMISFSYNLGEGALRGSTLRKKHNAGDYQGAALEFQRWNKAGGRPIAGLTRRRLAEAAVYGQGDYRV